MINLTKHQTTLLIDARKKMILLRDIEAEIFDKLISDMKIEDQETKDHIFDAAYNGFFNNLKLEKDGMQIEDIFLIND